MMPAQVISILFNLIQFISSHQRLTNVFLLQAADRRWSCRERSSSTCPPVLGRSPHIFSVLFMEVSANRRVLVDILHAHRQAVLKLRD